MKSATDTASKTASGEAWLARLPHLEIDALLERLTGAVNADPAEAARLVRLVAREAQNLRAVTLRLVVERLAEADRQSAAILAEATRQAAALRKASVNAFNARLDEADRFSADIRDSLRAELHADDVVESAATDEDVAR